MVPRLLGPQLNKMSKFPRLLPSDVPLAAVVEEYHRTARVALRKAPTLQVAGTGTSPPVGSAYACRVCRVQAVYSRHLCDVWWGSGPRGHERRAAHPKRQGLLSRAGGGAAIVGPSREHRTACHQRTVVHRHLRATPAPLRSKADSYWQSGR